MPYSPNGKKNQPKSGQSRQAEVDVDIRQEPALSDHVGLKELQPSERRIAATAAVAVDESGVLVQGVSDDGIQSVCDIQKP